MTLLGTVKNGVVVIDGDTQLADGTVVRIEPIDAALKAADSQQSESLAMRLRKVVGTASGLPTDLAKNHDHYLHGHERK